MAVPTHKLGRYDETWTGICNKELIKAVKAVWLERFAANSVCMSLSTVKMWLKSKEYSPSLVIF